MSLLAAALLAASALGLPGCLEDGVSLLTAQEAREHADTAAEEWQDDATLVNIFGIEAGPEAREQLSGLLQSGNDPSEGDADADERAMLAAVSGADDDVPGDGKAPVWMFSYVADEEGFLVGVTSAGVLFAQQGDGEETSLFGNRPVEGWRIDSDDGADVARQDKGYEEAVADPRAMAFTILVQSESTPVWLFGVETPGVGDDEGEPDETFVAVDAASGEPIDAEELLQGLLGFTIREAGSIADTITAPDDAFDATFDVELAGHGVLAILVSVSPPPLLAWDITVTDPAGTVYAGTVDARAALDSTHTLVINAVLAGEYAVEVEAGGAVVHDWEVAWCTDGQAVIPIDSRACDAVGTARQSQAETLSWPAHWPWA